MMTKGVIEMKKILALVLMSAMIFTALTGCGILYDLIDHTDLPNDFINDNGKSEKDPPVFKENGDCKINSIDKVNYYAAVCVLSKTPIPIGLTDSNCKISFLGDYAIDEDKPPENEFNTDEGSDDVSDEGESSVSENIIQYELSRDDVFSFEKVSMFQIILTDAEGFLASRLGLGVVDVVITEDCIWGEGLITFRNGENFFSCLSNGFMYDKSNSYCRWDFSTHKYVDGFYIVKNIEQENYAFYIDMDAAGQVTGFECGLSENGGDRADRNVTVSSSTVISSAGGRFTLSELEAYFKKDDPLEDSEPAV